MNERPLLYRGYSGFGQIPSKAVRQWSAQVSRSTGRLSIPTADIPR